MNIEEEICARRVFSTVMVRLFQASTVADVLYQGGNVTRRAGVDAVIRETST